MCYGIPWQIFETRGKLRGISPYRGTITFKRAMAAKFNITLISGGVGSGKSTQGQVICNDLSSLKDQYKILWIDSSLCIKNSKLWKNKPGLQLLRQGDFQEKGLLGDSRPVVDSIMENLHWLKRRHIDAQHFIIPGGGRACEEIDVWDELVSKGIVSYRVVFIECTKKQTSEGIERRIKSGELRADQGPAELERRLKEYKTKTLPMLKHVRPELLHLTHRTKPARVRTIETVSHMDIPYELKRTFITRLKTDTHPIQQVFARLDGEVPKKELSYDEFIAKIAPRWPSSPVHQFTRA